MNLPKNIDKSKIIIGLLVPVFVVVFMIIGYFVFFFEPYNSNGSPKSDMTKTNSNDQGSNSSKPQTRIKRGVLKPRKRRPIKCGS
jgi:hypothetical protein